MSLKEDALCPSASLATLRPICYRGTHRLQGIPADTFMSDLFSVSSLL